MKTTILIATQNKGKIEEILSILDGKFTIETLIGENTPEPQETGTTFEENAILKAKYYYEIYKIPAIADDSGMEIEALNAFPGVKTKNFMEENGSYEASFRKLEEMLRPYPKPYKTKFISVVAYVDSQRVIVARGEDDGQLQFPPKGSQGFGFDPIFVSNGFTKTFAELGPEVKKNHSHRAKALKNLQDKLFGTLLA